MIKLFDKPRVIAIIGDINSGKSNLLYHVLNELKNHKFNLYTYGLKSEIKKAQKIGSLIELELIRNSIIIIDEFYSLFDLDDRGKKRLIEETLRKIHHNNNVLILCGLPENFKKFISAKVDVYIFKQITYDDFINGSRSKKIATNYCGEERGSFVLTLEKDKALIFPYENHYKTIDVPYYQKHDSKKNNVNIIVEKTSKKTSKICQKKVETIIEHG